LSIGGGALAPETPLVSAKRLMVAPFSFAGGTLRRDSFPQNRRTSTALVIPR